VIKIFIHFPDLLQSPMLPLFSTRTHKGVFWSRRSEHWRQYPLVHCWKTYRLLLLVNPFRGFLAAELAAVRHSRSIYRLCDMASVILPSLNLWPIALAYVGVGLLVAVIVAERHRQIGDGRSGRRLCAQRNACYEC
jgi:hypothetical protein